MKRFIAPPAFVAASVVYLLLLVFIIALFILDHMVIAIEAVCTFLGHHANEQRKLFKESIDGK